MSETTATRIARTTTLAAAATAWCVCAWLLARTSVPPLRLTGEDPHRYFDARLLMRTARFAHGEDVLLVGAEAVELAALVVLVRFVPRLLARMRRGALARTIVAGVGVLVTVWLVRLPFAVADLWWQHHCGLGPFDVPAWLTAQLSSTGPEALGALATIVLLVTLARRSRLWWLIASPVVVAVAGTYLLVSGWLSAVGTHPLRSAPLAADVRRLERIEGVPGTPVRVQDVSARTSQANAFTEGFGPSTRVVLWSTLLDGRFTRREIDVVIAHELGHVRSRHIEKSIGWAALAVLPTLWLLELLTRRRGGVGDPANVPFALLALAVLLLALTPLVQLVSRRYEAEADWRALNAARDPAAQRHVFERFARTSLEQPDPPLLDYLWLESHPTLLQRVAMTRRWEARAGRSSRGGPGSP
jgi:STE24 endopeptidase